MKSLLYYIKIFSVILCTGSMLTLFVHVIFVKDFSGQRIAQYQILKGSSNFTSERLGPLSLDPAMGDIRLNITLIFRGSSDRKIAMVSLIDSEGVRYYSAKKTVGDRKWGGFVPKLSTYRYSTDFYPITVSKKAEYFFEFILLPENQVIPHLSSVPESVQVEIRQHSEPLNMYLAFGSIFSLLFSAVVLLVLRQEKI